ncbi:hypothetical protein FS837_007053 [Tulasnella sp. UAMH 9824]|nr:hypothetical protein FS837_007053 [Tulasnella sp. UAMH 9824]
MQATVLEDSRNVPVLCNVERIAGTQALIVPEILGTILDYATPPTLASAARVSRTWSAIALDKLWSNAEVKVVELLRILPLRLEEDPDPQWRVWTTLGYQQTLQRNPTNDEWTRFCSYASRIRSLVLPSWESDRFDPRITEWEVEKNVLFPRLRKMEYQFKCTIPFIHLRFFVSPTLRELSLDIGFLSEVELQEAQSFLDCLAATENLRLQKFKLDCSGANKELAVQVAKVSAANKHSIETLEIRGLSLYPLLMVGQSLQNLKALDFDLREVGGEEVTQVIQALVEGCPHVAYLRLRFTSPLAQTDLLDLPGLRMILAWNLLSLETQIMGGVYFSKANIGEMGQAWPKLKKLHCSWSSGRSRIYLPLSHLADAMAAFPELEELGGYFYYAEEEETLLRNHQPWSEEGRPLRLQKLRLGRSPLPASQDHRDLVAQYLAGVLPPGLRIERTYSPGIPLDEAQLAEAGKAAAMGRDFEPGWDALFRKIEELQGGVQIWVGRIPGDSEGVWF